MLKQITYLELLELVRSKEQPKFVNVEKAQFRYDSSGNYLMWCQSDGTFYTLHHYLSQKRNFTDSKLATEKALSVDVPPLTKRECAYLAAVVTPYYARR